ncbi:MAG: sigma-70 family RNA polymerase sigma factor [Verrucomicrobia bacterium]|nr:sigma-70 family RNA polymerase sigma factor [Verrucomicrobiota bacterium]
MSFPTTPRTLLGRLKKDSDDALWQSSWDEFFDIYHQAVRVCVSHSFTHRGWHTLSDSDVEDVTMRVFQSFHEAQPTFELEDAKGRLRQFITTLCQRRVVDFMRSQRRHNEGRVWFDSDQYPDVPEEASALDEKVSEAFRAARSALLFSVLREQVSPRIFMIFESVKLHCRKPEDVARELGVTRGVVDNSIHKAMVKLRAIQTKLPLEDIE